MILAGDIGGTKTTLALFEMEGGRLVRRAEGSFPSGGHAGLADVVHAFLPRPRPTLSAVGFGVAGPVSGGRARTTNLPWEVDAGELGDLLGTPPALLLNDLEAMAWGIEMLEPGEFQVLQDGSPDPEGGAALIAAGTGLGEALMIRHEGRFLPRATEGGHADFAPGDAEASAFLAWLQRGLGHVSAERVASGMGLGSLYAYFHEPGRSHLPRHDPAGSDAARILAESAAAGTCASCVKGFGLFLRCYGAEAGNLALKAGATSGLFIGGGIAAKNLEAMGDGRFIRAFRAKGRYEGYMRNVPVKVLLNQSAPLLGAALAAARLAGQL